jgi:RHS repeat-associated protein
MLSLWRYTVFLAVGLLTALVYAGVGEDLIFRNGFENNPPIITSSPATTARINARYTYDVDAIDIDGDTLLFQLTTAPGGMLINNSTGKITWTPDAVGIFTAAVGASDGEGGLATQSWDIEVFGHYDPDDDGLTDEQEYILGTDPNDPDTDDDGLNDGDEVGIHGTDPLLFDTDGDDFGDGSEIGAATDPLDDTDFPEGPPDPEAIAPEIDPTEITTVYDSTKFLYTGNDPIQTGVAEGTIDALTASVLRGKVMSRDGTPLQGVTVSIHEHPEYGETLTRHNGIFDMAVNGGQALIVQYLKQDFLPVQRQVHVPWQNYVRLPDAIMITVDPSVTAVDLTSPEPFQAARGSVVTDDAGTRQAVLMIPQGTSAEIMLPDGTPQSITTLSLRATEYTVGENGPETMPAELPPTSGYTYAVELSADEALANGIRVNGTDVVLSQPVPFYVDNFLDFPVGTIAPTGYYDDDRGAWIPHDSGLVIGIVDITGSLADVDVDGDGSADTGTALSDLGITDAEREQLAALYPPGKSLWRVQLTHLSSWDVNWSFGPPDDAIKPLGPKKKKKPDKPCKDEKNSVIECQNQTLGESVPVTGTPFTLTYQSDRVQGHLDSFTTEIPLSGTTVPASLLRIELEVSVAGQEFKQVFPPNPNQSYRFTWDGKDAYGRTPQGAQSVEIRVGFTYQGSYQETDRFGYNGNGTVITGSKTRQEVTLWQEWTDSIGVFAARGQGLGGWTLNVHHTYNPLVETLYLGDGSRRSAWGIFAIDTMAGGGGYCAPADPCGDSGPAVNARLYYPTGIASGPDGSIYIADLNNDRIRRVGPDGIITTVAGTGTRGFSGDGGPATEAELFGPRGAAVGPDGSVFIADTGNNRIRRVGPDGTITTVAGTGTNGYSGDGGPATEAQLYGPSDVAIGADGSIYIADTITDRIRYVGPDGIITTVAGNGETYGDLGDGGPATDARLYLPHGVAVAPDGSIYIADTQNDRIRHVRPDGIITTVAGTGTRGYSGNGGPATEAQLNLPSGVAVGSNGSLLVADTQNDRVRRVGPDGIITLVAGIGTGGFSGDGGPPTEAELYDPYDVAIGPDGTLYIADRNNNRIRSIETPFPGFAGEDIVIPSEDGSRLYHFDANGRHLRTLSTLTAAVLYTFNYDTDGLLVGIVDGNGNTTTITRDSSGNPTSIVGPGSQTTDLVVNGDGYLGSLSNPADEIVAVTYTTNGLLDSFTDPNGNSSQYTYSPMGLLTLARDRAGGTSTFSRSDTTLGYTVTKSTAMGRVTTYQMEYFPTGEERSYKEYPDGTWNEVLTGTDASTTVTSSDGTVITMKHGPDPRFGMLAPVLESFTVKTPGGVTNALTQSRVVSLSDPDDVLSLQTIYDTKTINGRTYTYNYDATTRRFTSTSPEGHQTISVVDTLGRVTSTDLAAQVDPITISYNAQGLITQFTQGAQSWTFSHDALRRVISRIDEAGNETSFSYDAADRIVQVDLPDGGTEGYAYDENGNLATVVMPNGYTHALGYTPLDFLESYTPPDNPSYTRGYDLDKALTSRKLPSGKVVTNRFDAGGRWTEISYPAATVEFAYAGSCCEQLARLTRTPTSSGTAQVVDYAYDGELLVSAIWSGVAIGEYQYSYDQNFFLMEMVLESGLDTVQTSFTWDLDGMATGYGPFTLVRGGPGGTVSQIDDGNHTLTIGYDSLARVQSRNQTVNGKSVYGFVLAYNNVGRIVQKVETVDGVSHVFDYTYDADGRLTEVTRDGTLTERYTYDVNGNRLSTLFATASYGSQDRLTSIDNVSYTFNVDGYLSQRGTDTFEYSSRGELVSATPGGATTITYSYDGLGRRVGRIDSSGTYQYLYGFPGRPFLVTNVRDPGDVLTTFYYDGNGLLFAMNRGGSMYYVGTDQIGTPHVVADSTGTVVKVVEYDSFGNRLSDSNPGFDLPIGFAGGLEDIETGLVRFGYRDFEQTSGRWTVRDPALYEGGQANLYVYVGNDPVSLRDPLGLWCIGGSVYKVVGFGVELCCEFNGYCSRCAEVGFGAGVSVSLGLGGAKETGSNIAGEAGLSCGPAGWALKCAYDFKCGLGCKAEGTAGPVKFDSSGGRSINKSFGASKCGYQAKVAAQKCVRF